jgi:hypothetical protein
MGKLPNTLKSSQHLTPKQKKFAEVMVAKWGQITKAEAVREAGYDTKARQWRIRIRIETYKSK